MKIGIYTLHANYNYGALLQAYAMQKVLERAGHQAELVNLSPLTAEEENESKLFSWRFKSILTSLYSRGSFKVQKKHARFRKFHSQMNLSKRYYSLDEIYKNPPEYDIHLVGSDQVWNLERGFPKKSLYFLDFLKSEKIKVSYAASFGTQAIDEKCYEPLKKALMTFNAISVREKDGVNIIKNAAGLVAEQVLDPTFLLDAREWESLIAPKPLIKGKYIFCYGFDNSEKSQAMVAAIRERLRFPVVIASVSVFPPRKIKRDKFIQDAGPIEFLDLVRNAAFVCTGSYHGVAFAIHFRKSFFAAIHPTRNSRMESLLKKLGLEHRQLHEPSEIRQMLDDELFINYSRVEFEIKKESCNSMRWLMENIQGHR